jgi:hypothetical protein
MLSGFDVVFPALIRAGDAAVVTAAGDSEATEAFCEGARCGDSQRPISKHLDHNTHTHTQVLAHSHTYLDDG